MKRYILGYETEDLDLIPENLTLYKTMKQANKEAEEWCTVDAETLEEAKNKYEEVFEQHKEEGRINGPF